MKRIYKAYKEILGILFSESPSLVIITFLSAIVSGLITPLSVWANSRIFDMGILAASGKINFLSYIPYLILFPRAMSQVSMADFVPLLARA